LVQTKNATPDVLQVFKVNGSKVKVTASRNVSASKNCYMLRMDWSTEF